MNYLSSLLLASAYHNPLFSREFETKLGSKLVGTSLSYLKSADQKVSQDLLLLPA